MKSSVKHITGPHRPIRGDPQGNMQLARLQAGVARHPELPGREQEEDNTSGRKTGSPNRTEGGGNATHSKAPSGGR